MPEQETIEKIKDEELERTCSDCGSTDIAYEHSEYYCKKCGLVLDL